MISNNDWGTNYGNEIAMGYLKRALEEYNKHSEKADKLTEEQIERIRMMMSYSFDLMSTEQAYRNYYKN